MWLQKPGRDTRRWRATLLAALAGTAALATFGCGAAYVENSEASVLLQIRSINGGAQLDSDVRNGPPGEEFVCENEVDVQVGVENKNPNGPAAASSAVRLESYEIRFTRSDGRGTEGIDVPYRVTGTLATTINVGEDVTFPLEVVRRQAKIDPPLTNIQQTTILTVSAQVTLFGKTISEKGVSASGRFQIDFANFRDTDQSCPE